MAAHVAPYLAANPVAARALAALQALPGATVHIDHFAFRTFGAHGLGLEAVARQWLDFGYERRDALLFPAKRLRAFWFAPPPPLDGGDSHLPRVFVSEVDVPALSSGAQAIIAKYAERAEGLAPHAGTASLLRTPLWGAASREDYEALAAESEYAAWTLVNGNALNHATVAVHRLGARGLASIEDVNTFVAAQGIALNTDGGLLKVSPDGLLRQSSTVADTWTCTFADGSSGTVPGAHAGTRAPLASRS